MLIFWWEYLINRFGEIIIGRGIVYPILIPAGVNTLQDLHWE